ncbi:MAG: sodium:solute symporter family protein [Candidatus Aminicenantes bacterium]|nr:sodium:solute symporter family protein [Candidatus Aminicenantes bacterium]
MVYFGYLIGYVTLILLVGILFSRKMQSIEDFFLASRSLPAVLVYFSLAASWLGATSILVSIDEAYIKGVSSFWVIGIPSVLTVMIFGFFLVRPIRRLPIVTLPDLFEMRYGRIVRHMTSILIVWYMALLAASQMVALGNFLKAFLGTSYFSSLLIGTAVVLIYSIGGGFLSVVITDGFQFFLLTVGIVSLFFFLTGQTTMSDVFTTAAQMGRTNYFDFFVGFERNVWIVVSFTLAWIISPIVWQRIQASRSDKDARRGLISSGVTFFVFFGVIVMIGVLCLPLLPMTASQTPVLSLLLTTKTGHVLGGLLFVAVIAAIMSTMDTAINTGALSLTRDVFQQIFPQGRLKKVIQISRLSTFLMGALSFLIATRVQGILKSIGLASEIMTEGLFIPGMAMIFLRKRFPTAGFASLLLGGGYSLLGFMSETGFLHLEWPEWPYSVPYGLVLSLCGFLAGFLFDAWRRKAN